MHDILHVRTLVLLSLAIGLLFLALRSLRAGRLKERYVLLFVFTGVPFLVFALWPDLIVWASQTLQIEKATLLVMCVATYFILTTFELLSILSVQDRKLATLGQTVAILAAERDAIARAAAAPDTPTPPSPR